MRRPDSAVLGYTTLRLGMGMSMLIHGVNRIGGVPAFAREMVAQFSRTWLPESAVIAFAYITPPVELIVGILVLAGLFTPLGLAAGGAWMVVLIFGSTLAKNYDVVGIQLLYSLIFFVLLRHEALNELSVDRLIRGKTVRSPPPDMRLRRARGPRGPSFCPWQSFALILTGALGGSIEGCRPSTRRSELRGGVRDG